MTSIRPYSEASAKRPRLNEPKADEDDVLAKLRRAAEEATGRLAAIFGSDSGSKAEDAEAESGNADNGDKADVAVEKEMEQDSASKNDREDLGILDFAGFGASVVNSAVDDSSDFLSDIRALLSPVGLGSAGGETKKSEERTEGKRDDGDADVPAGAKVGDSPAGAASDDEGGADKGGYAAATAVISAAMAGPGGGTNGSVTTPPPKPLGKEKAGDGVTEINDFLTELGIAQYLQEFLMNGYDTMTAVRALDEEDMREVGMAESHIEKLMERLEADAPFFKIEPPPEPPPMEAAPFEAPVESSYESSIAAMGGAPAPAPDPGADPAALAKARAMALATCAGNPTLGAPAAPAPMTMAPPSFVGARQCAPVLMRSSPFEGTTRASIPAGILAMRAKEMKTEAPNVPAGILAMRARAKAAALTAE